MASKLVCTKRAVKDIRRPDPAGQFWSPYSYAGGMPHMLIAPDGEFALVPILVMGGLNGERKSIERVSNIHVTLKLTDNTVTLSHRCAPGLSSRI